MDETKKDLSLRFDWFGFTALAIGIGALQLALDRGEQLGWTESNEIIAEFIIAGVGFYYFLAHSLTTSTPFIQFSLFKDRNFITGCIFMARTEKSRSDSSLTLPFDRKANDPSWYQGCPASVVPEA